MRKKYIIKLMTSEQRVNKVTSCASNIRKILLETSGNQNNISEALKAVCDFVKSRSAIFFNTDGEEYNYGAEEYTEELLAEKEKKYLMAQLFRYATEYQKITGMAVNILCIKPNKHLLKTNEDFYEFLKRYKISEISFSNISLHS